MLYRNKRSRASSPGGFFSLEDEITKSRMYGFGFGNHIAIRDEFGTLWRGVAERGDDDAVRYVFRDGKGRSLSGVSDQYGIVLRDAKGRTWRGIVD